MACLGSRGPTGSAATTVAGGSEGSPLEAWEEAGPAYAWISDAWPPELWEEARIVCSNVYHGPGNENNPLCLQTLPSAFCPPNQPSPLELDLKSFVYFFAWNSIYAHGPPPCLML